MSENNIFNETADKKTLTINFNDIINADWYLNNNVTTLRQVNKIRFVYYVLDILEVFPNFWQTSAIRQVGINTSIMKETHGRKE